MDKKILYLFKNTRSVVKAQNELVKNRLKCLILPVPRNISSECGMCIETLAENEIMVDKLLEKIDINFNKTVDY
ncbi:MAG: DUF3343 domain-containing protein [Spirochaetales bacterium]|nr:DUF3343 domain-containing protein [Spirochaetales bacterium]